MTVQIKAMLDQIAQLTKAIANKENAPKGGGVGNSGSSSRNKGQARCEYVQYDKPHTMGSYFSSHGFHPAGVNHTSTTCSRTLVNHDATATWNDRKGSSIYWPKPICISVEQQSHATYAGKSAPTN